MWQIMKLFQGMLKKTITEILDIWELKSRFTKFENSFLRNDMKED